MMETMKVSVTTPIATPKMVSDERSLFALTVATAIAADSFMSSKDMLNSKAPPSSVALLLAAPLKPRQQRTYQEHVGHGQGFDVPVSFVQVGAQEFVAPLVREKLLVATVGPGGAGVVPPTRPGEPLCCGGRACACGVCGARFRGRALRLSGTPPRTAAAAT